MTQKRLIFFVVAVLALYNCSSDNDDSPFSAGSSSESSSDSSSGSEHHNSSSSFGKNISYIIIEDIRDGKLYKSVEIGTQVWMAENLNYAGEDGNAGRCYQDNEDHCETYGRLYTFAEAACPEGWHLPSSEELDILLKHVDPNYTGYGNNAAGTKLKATSGWQRGEGITAPSNPNGTDDYGFAALPGGFCGSQCIQDNFTNLGTMSYWWTTSMGSPVTLSITWNVSSSTNSVANAMQSYNNSRFYARCIKQR